MKENNYTIDFLKFIFCIVIVSFHSYKWTSYDKTVFEYGSICVEFFFIVSGFLMAASANKKQNNNLGIETFNYIWKKIKNFFPYIMMSFILGSLLNLLINDIKISLIIKSLFELVFLNMFIYPQNTIIGFTWYISSMIFGMLLLFPLIKKFGDTYFYIIAPIIFLVLLCYLSNNYNTLKAPFDDTALLLYKGTLRAIMELTFGSILFKINGFLSKLKFRIWFKILMSIIEFCGYIVIIVFLTYTNNYDYVTLFIFGFLILLSFSKITYINSLLSYNFVNYLGKISLPIYVFQNCSILLMKKFYFNAEYYNALFLYIYISILLGIIAYHIVNRKKLKFNIKKLILVD